MGGESAVVGDWVMGLVEVAGAAETSWVETDMKPPIRRRMSESRCKSMVGLCVEDGISLVGGGDGSVFPLFLYGRVTYGHG